MLLLDSFYDLIEAIGVDRAAISEDDGDGFKIVSFNEKIEHTDIISNISIVFYDDNESVEIYIRCLAKNNDFKKLLPSLNDLNAEYCGMSFFAKDGTIAEKIYCRAEGNIETVVGELMRGMVAARQTFPDLLRKSSQ